MNLRNDIITSLKYRSLIKNKGHIDSSANIRYCNIKGNVNIGIKSTLNKVNITGHVEIGNFTSINGEGTCIYSLLNSIEIGNFCSIARGVQIQEYNHKIDYISSYTFNNNLFKGSKSDDYTSKGNVTIGNDVWVGANVIILSGVTIGNGAVVAAGTVVTKNIPDYAIFGGNPGKVLKFRFKKNQIDLLNSLCWWNWSEEKIKENRNLFINSNFQDFL